MKDFKLVHETPDHFVLHNGVAHFHVAKSGITGETAEKIRGLANGGRTTAGDITQSENKKNMHTIDANITAAKNYSEGGPTDDTPPVPLTLMIPPQQQQIMIPKKIAPTWA